VRKQNPKSPPTTKEKKIPLNQSFDTSRLVEDIFETELNQVQAKFSQNSEQPETEKVDQNGGENVVPDRDHVRGPAVIEAAKPAATVITTPILKSKSPLGRNLNSSEKKIKRVSWVDQVSNVIKPFVFLQL
jgi:hypothetical protein